MSHRITIDDEVAMELRRRKLPSDSDYYGPPMKRALEEQELEERLRGFGLGPQAYRRLLELKALRAK